MGDAPNTVGLIIRDQKSHAQAMEGVAAHRQQGKMSRKGAV